MALARLIFLSAASPLSRLSTPLISISSSHLSTPLSRLSHHADGAAAWRFAVGGAVARRGRASAEARIRWRLGVQARQSGGWLRCGRNAVARRGARFLSPAGPLTSLAPLHPKDPAAGLQIQSNPARIAKPTRIASSRQPNRLRPHPFLSI